MPASSRAPRGLPAGWKPSEPLTDRHEQFCQLVVSGESVRGAGRAVNATTRMAHDWVNGDTPLARAMQKRITYLRSRRTVVLPSAPSLLKEWLDAARQASADGAHKAALEAYERLYVLREKAEREGVVPAWGEAVTLSGDVHALLSGDSPEDEEPAPDESGTVLDDDTDGPALEAGEAL